MPSVHIDDAVPLLLGCAALGAVVGAASPRVIARYAPAHPTSTGRTARTTVTGSLAFGLIANALGRDPVLPVLLAVAAVGVPLAFVDLACLRLPDPLVGTAAALAAGGLGLVAVTTGDAGTAPRALAAGLACLIGYVLLALLPAARLGFGDVKLAGVLGLPLGWLGWDTLLCGVLAAHLIGGVVAVALLVSGRVSRRAALPFGPALLAGALVAVAVA